MSHVLLSEINKLLMLRALESGRYLSIAFQLWDLYALTEHNQAFVDHQDDYSAQEAALCHFRYANKYAKTSYPRISRFDDCKLTNAKLYLNSKCYPYNDLNLDKYLIKTDM